MVDVTYLAPDDEKPYYAHNMPWLEIYAADDGRFFGSGESWNESGDWVFYLSSPENESFLETALAAALDWSEKYAVPTIWILPQSYADQNLAYS